MQGSVEVAAFSNSLEAGLAQAWLEEHGVPSEIDGLALQSWAAGEVAITGFRVLVAPQDAARALALLERTPASDGGGSPVAALRGEPGEASDATDAQASEREGTDLGEDADEDEDEDGQSEAPAEERPEPDAGREVRPAAGAVAICLVLVLASVLTALVTLTWVIALLWDSPVAARVAPPARLLLKAGALLVALALAISAYAFPLHLRSAWVWAVDAVFAVCVLLGYLSARRRWRAG